MKPHLCPKCNGYKVCPRDAPQFAKYAGYSAGNMTCPVCSGTGVLWEFEFTPLIPYIPKYAPASLLCHSCGQWIVNGQYHICPNNKVT